MICIFLRKNYRSAPSSRRRQQSTGLLHLHRFKSHLPSSAKKKKHPKGCFLAEKEGFEPSIPFWGIHDFQSCALGQLRDFSKFCNQLAYNTTSVQICQPLISEKWGKIRPTFSRFVQIGCYTILHRSHPSTKGLRDSPAQQFFHPSSPKSHPLPGWWTADGQR